MHGPPGDEPVGRAVDRAVDRAAEPFGLGRGIDGGHRRWSSTVVIDGGQDAGVTVGADRKGVGQDAGDRVRGAGLAAVGIADQLGAAAQQVRQAALVPRMCRAWANRR
jgi:hypothetical protein